MNFAIPYTHAMTSSMPPKDAALTKFQTLDLQGMDLLIRCATDSPLVVKTLLDAIAEVGAFGIHIIELSFGVGWLLEEIHSRFPQAHLYGLELSIAMGQRAKSRYGADIEIILGDIERMPFSSSSFDVVVTNWTLYFMQDIDGALGEIKRCLKPGGRLVASTSAPDHEIEFGRLVATAVCSALDREMWEDITSRFDLETGRPYMERHFSSVALREWHGELVLPDVQSVLITWERWRPAWLAGSDNEAVRTELTRLSAQQLERNGPIRMRRHGGAFIAES